MSYVLHNEDGRKTFKLAEQVLYLQWSECNSAAKSGQGRHCQSRGLRLYQYSDHIADGQDNESENPCEAFTSSSLENSELH